MKKSEVIDLYQALSGAGGLKGVKFAYAIARNLNLLKGEIEALDNAAKPSDEFQKYETKRIELAQKYSKKDKDGNPVIDGNQFVLEDKKSFDDKFEKLREESKEALEQREKQLKEYEELLKTEVEITLHKINIKDVPEEITASQMTAIFSLVESNEI